MRTRRALAVIAVLVLASSGSGCMTTGWQPSFEQSSYKIMISSETRQGAEGVPTGLPLSESAVQAEVDRLLALKPKEALPARVLLYQVPGSGRTNITSPLKAIELRQATNQEMRKTLEGAGAFRSVSFLPEILLPEGTLVDLKTVRIAAARAQADAVLIYSTEAGYESKPNDWAALYLTVLGVAFVPGTDATSMAVSQAVLLDVSSGYIYFVTEDYGTDSTRAPIASIDAQQLEYDARLKSLTELSNDVASRAMVLKAAHD
jgi:hypothetical protein